MQEKPFIGISMNFMKLGQFNQFHIRDKYIEAVYDNGGLPLPIPCFVEHEDIKAYLLQIKGLIIIGGMDYPPRLYGQTPHPLSDIMTERRAESDLLLFKTAMELKLPILGICAGLQLMNIATGGRLIQHLETAEQHLGEKYHPVMIENSRWLSKIFNTDRLIVNSNHHQGIDGGFVGQGFTPVAWSEDGQIEAIEYNCDQLVLGVQWHPERISTYADNALTYADIASDFGMINRHRNLVFSYFIENARNAATQR
ncbi:MAG: gamma-glutamyl-gamma-aminobutyrate hydrolase family protein [Candidatus Cloacimonetes bacterium]|nr:gamma-glutamyl-gamma-aminobutyrate hydrolase family protein [Candidatus Cloacimonadota bacterium]